MARSRCHSEAGCVLESDFMETLARRAVAANVTAHKRVTDWTRIGDRTRSFCNGIRRAIQTTEGPIIRISYVSQQCPCGKFIGGINRPRRHSCGTLIGSTSQWRSRARILR
jgi:hypothetical protein